MTKTALNLTLNEAISRLDQSMRPKRNDLSSERKSPSTEWDLNTGFSTACKYAEFGWKEKIDQVQAFINSIEHLCDNKWVTHCDVSGECVDVGAFLDGTPECMLNFNVPEMKSLRIVANISARFNADARYLFNRGIALAAAVYALQRKGTAVSLAIGNWVNNSSNDEHQILVEVNPFGDYLDPGRLAFWLGHPAALRRCMFRFKEQQPDPIIEKFGFHENSGYGSPKDPDREELREQEIIFIPFPETNKLQKYTNPEVAFSEIQKLLKEQGVELFK